jgi:hypothetical protein
MATTERNARKLRNRAYPPFKVLVKYCISCGKQSDDQAAFCAACGQKFPDESSPSPVQQGAATATTAVAAAAQPGTLLTAERGSGAHKHMLTDVFLKDASGKVLLVARKPSLLHEDYTIVDGNESVCGFMKSKSHLTHSGLGVEDASHNLQAAVQHSNFESSSQVGPLRKQNPPNCWIEDAAGNRLASIVFTNWVLGFSGVKPDGSEIFEASLAGGTGMRQELSAMESRTYSVNLLDPGFPLPTLLAILVVANKIGG